MRRYCLMVTSLILLLGGCSAESERPEPALSIEEVASGIYVHTGKHVPFDSQDSDDIANIGFIVGDDCVAVIDSGGSVAMGKALKQTIAAITDIPVCYVIDSHVHYDHLLGNLPFKQAGVEFIGHAKLTDALAASETFFLEEFPQYLGNTPAEAVVGPNRLVDDTLALDLGNRVLEIKAWPPAHTNNDLSIYDRQTETLWAADLLFMERMPALDANLKGWLAAMDKLAKIPAKRVVPGHGPAVAEWPQALNDQRRYLSALLEETRAAIAEGQFLDEAMDTVASDEASKWQLADQHHRRNVSRAYRELEWE